MYENVDVRSEERVVVSSVFGEREWISKQDFNGDWVTNTSGRDVFTGGENVNNLNLEVSFYTSTSKIHLLAKRDTTYTQEGSLSNIGTYSVSNVLTSQKVNYVDRIAYKKFSITRQQLIGRPITEKF